MNLVKKWNKKKLDQVSQKYKLNILGGLIPSKTNPNKKNLNQSPSAPKSDRLKQLRIKKPEVGKLNLKLVDPTKINRFKTQNDEKVDHLKYFISSTRSNRDKFNGKSMLLQGLYDYLLQKPSDSIVRKMDFYYSPYSTQFSTQRFMTFGDDRAKENLNQTLRNS